MKKSYLSYLILATILILVSCTGSATTDTTTDTKDLNGACNFKIYDTSNGTERVSADGTCKDAGTTLTLNFNTPINTGGTKKSKKIVIDSTAKTLTIIFEDDTTQTNESSPGAAITMTTKPDSWEVFINDRLFAKVIAN